MVLIPLFFAYLILGYFVVDWSNWKTYYPTIQFYIICNLLYNFLFYRHALWSYAAKTSWLNHTVIDLTFTFLIVPMILMVYLRHVPDDLKKLFKYVLLWTAVFTLIEFIFLRVELFFYSNGWSIVKSAIFNFFMFTILSIHYKRPLLALLISIPVIIMMLFFHHPSFLDLK